MGVGGGLGPRALGHQYAGELQVEGPSAEHVPTRQVGAGEPPQDDQADRGGDEDTKSVSFADAGLAAPSPSPPGLLPRAEKEMGDVNCSGPREGPWPSCLEPTCTVRGAREWLASAREQGGESDTEDGSAPYTQHVVSGCQHGPFFLMNLQIICKRRGPLRIYCSPSD